MMSELESLCYQMSYGDDSKKTFDKYCELAGLAHLTEEERENLRQETFYDYN
jgi:hypothetical protein